MPYRVRTNVLAYVVKAAEIKRLFTLAGCLPHRALSTEQFGRQCERRLTLSVDWV